MATDLTAPADAAPLTFARRAEPDELPELMDEPCAYADLRACLRDFAQMNRIIRGYPPTLTFLNRIAGQFPNARPLRVPDAVSSRPLRILDVGSGGGDTLRLIANATAALGIPVELTGIDLNPHATRAAQEFCAPDRYASAITFLTADVFTYTPDPQPDVILSALFTHHLSSPDIPRFLRWMDSHARLGWFINDLHRSARAAFWFRFLPVIFRWHRFIHHDGPVSLRRAFTPADWQAFLAAAHITGAAIESHPMNRLCISRIRPPA